MWNSVTCVLSGFARRLLFSVVLTSHKQLWFSHRIINNWNELPDSVVLADNLNMFKRIFFLEA